MEPEAGLDAGPKKKKEKKNCTAYKYSAATRKLARNYLRNYLVTVELNGPYTHSTHEGSVLFLQDEVFQSQIFKCDYRLFFFVSNKPGSPVPLHACSCFAETLLSAFRYIYFFVFYVNPSAWRCVLLLQDYNTSLSGGLPHMKYCFAALRFTAKILHYE